MPPNPRIKGQEVEVTILQDGQLVLNNTAAIESNSMEAQLEILSEGFLGETTNRKDNIFNGWSGEVSMQFSGPQVFTMVNGFIDQATRRVITGVGVNIKHVYKFSNGRRAIVTFPDVAVGAVKIDTGGRSDYVKVSFPYEVGNNTITLV